MNDWLCLDEASASRLSLDDKPTRFDVPTDLFVGSEESAEFHRQSRDLAAHWPLGEYRSVPARDHFAILDELVEGGSIANSVLGRFGGMDPKQQH